MVNPSDLKADTVKVNINRKRYLIIVLLLISVTAVVILLSVKSSPLNLKKIYTKQSAVEIKTTYKNPFDKKTQYMNPFEKYKNPFVANR